MILCSITNLGCLQQPWKLDVALLWSPSLLRSGFSQWLMLHSESSKEPSTFCFANFVLPEETRTQGWECISEMWKCRRTSSTSEKVSKVPKEKIIECTEEKSPLVNPIWILQNFSNARKWGGKIHFGSQWGAMQKSTMLIQLLFQTWL